MPLIHVPANKDNTFGYKRAEIIGAFINLITLVLVAIFLIKEGVERFFDPFFCLRLLIIYFQFTLN